MPKQTKEELAREAAERKKSREDRLKKRDALDAAVTAGILGREKSRRQTADASDGDASPVKKPKRAESGSRRAAPPYSSDSGSVSDSGTSESDEIAATGAKPIHSNGSAKLKAWTLNTEKVDSCCVAMIYV